MANLTMDKLVALCKSRGFIFAGSEIYGGLANTWDYGPLGVELKNNIKRAWWKKFVQENTLNTGLDSAILMNPNVWVASGHVGGFSDPLMDCKSCKTRHRADNLIEDYISRKKLDLSIAGWSNQQMEKYIADNKIPCPNCGKCDFTGVRQFNLMFKTFQGVTEDSSMKVPFGIGQIGKSFRNEITPGNFIFRVREFEQMELEFFCKPGTDLEWFAYWKEFCKNWLLGLGIKEENLKLRDHDPEELSHYSNATTDFEFKFPFGWGELWGIADRTDFDLNAHAKVSGKNMEYTDPNTGEKYVPYVIEPSLGVERMVLTLLCNAYEEQELEGGDSRVVMHFHPFIAPYKVAVLPLQKKALGEKAEEIYKNLSKKFSATYDESASIGKRYRRQDEIGTPFCVTVDFDTLEDNCVTIRDRDTMEQVRISIDELEEYIAKRMEY